MGVSIEFARFIGATGIPIMNLVLERACIFFRQETLIDNGGLLFINRRLSLLRTSLLLGFIRWYRLYTERGVRKILENFLFIILASLDGMSFVGKLAKS